MTFAFTQPVAKRAMLRHQDGVGRLGAVPDALLASNDEFWSRLPKRPVHIKAATKLTNNAGSTRVASSVTATSDRLWLFSVEELAANRSIGALGKDYQYIHSIIGARRAASTCSGASRT